MKCPSCKRDFLGQVDGLLICTNKMCGYRAPADLELGEVLVPLLGKARLVLELKKTIRDYLDHEHGIDPRTILENVLKGLEKL